jgi:hypothetical protein
MSSQAARGHRAAQLTSPPPLLRISSQNGERRVFVEDAHFQRGQLIFAEIPDAGKR